MISTLILSLGVVFAIYYLFFRKKWENAPPGPQGFPLVGNLFQMEKLQHLSFSKWAKEYGSIYKLELASTRMVVVSDMKMMKEMFSQSAFSGRMDLSLFDVIMNGKVHGLVNTEGEAWEELRHFTLRQLRDFGFGKNSMEESIMIEVNEFIQLLKEVEGKPVSNVKDRFVLAVVNSLWFISVGKRHKQNDQGLLDFTNKAHELFGDLHEKGGIIIFAPWVAKWFPKWSGYEKVKQGFQNFANTFRVPVKEHLETYSEDFQRDFTDVFIKEIKKTTNPRSAFMGQVGENNLIATLSDFYFAGTDTTSTTLSWMIIYLTKFPEVQKKFQKEIEEITGNTRQCSVADRPNMPYTEALIAETLRFSSIAAQGVQHRALADTEFQGYFIPKDTLITANQFYIHFDPKIWIDPENFRPERFITDGKFKKNENLVAFSLGRRQCLGETLARDSLFLFATNLCQRFTVEFDKNGPDNGFQSEITFILTPKPFSVIFRDRLQ